MKGLNDWREEIDALDRELVALLNRRANKVLSLVPLKRNQGVPVHEPARESRVFKNIVASNRGPLTTDSLKRIFAAVIAEMRAMQGQRDR